jgi:hypothetical protein
VTTIQIYIAAALVLFASIGTNVLQLRHDFKMRAEFNVRLEKVMDANKESAKTLKAVQDSQAACEAGRVADKAAATSALALRDADVHTITESAAKSRAALASLLRTKQCAAWATAPACGVLP